MALTVAESAQVPPPAVVAVMSSVTDPAGAPMAAVTVTGTDLPAQSKRPINSYGLGESEEMSCFSFSCFCRIASA